MTAHAARPPILSAEAGPPVTLELGLPPDLECFQGHFPGCPILPGVVQLDWAIRFGSEYLGTSFEVARIVGLKFSRIVQPGAPLTLVLEATPGGLSFLYRQASETCSSGRIACA